MITLNHHHPVNYRDPCMLGVYDSPWLRAAHADRISSARFRLTLALRSGKVDRVIRAAARLDAVTDDLDGLAAAGKLFGGKVIFRSHIEAYDAHVARLQPIEYRRRGWLNEAGRWISA